MDTVLLIVGVLLLVAWGIAFPLLRKQRNYWFKSYQEQCDATRKTAATYIAENEKLREIISSLTLESDKWRLKAKELYYQIISSNGKFKTDYVPPSVQGIDDAAIRSINVQELPLDELPQKPMLPNIQANGQYKDIRGRLRGEPDITPGEFIRFNNNEYNRQLFSVATSAGTLYQVERIENGKIYCVGQLSGLMPEQVHRHGPWHGDRVDTGSEIITVKVWVDRVDRQDGNPPEFIRRDNLDRLRHKFNPNWVPLNTDMQPTGQPYTIPTKQTDMVMPAAPPIKHRDDKGRFVSQKRKVEC